MDINQRASFNERLLRSPTFRFAVALVRGRLSKDDLLLERMVQTGMNDIPASGGGGISRISQRLDGLDVGPASTATNASNEESDQPTRPLPRPQPRQSGVFEQFPQSPISDTLSRESGTEGARLNAHLPSRSHPPVTTMTVEPQRIAGVDMQQAHTKIGAGLWTADEAIDALGVVDQADITTLRRWQAMADQFADEPTITAAPANEMDDRDDAGGALTANSASEPDADPVVVLTEARRMLELADAQRFSEESDVAELLDRAQEYLTRARDGADEIFARLLSAMRAGDADTRQSVVVRQTAFLRQAGSCASEIEAARADPSRLSLLIPEIDKMVARIKEVNALRN